MRDLRAKSWDTTVGAEMAADKTVEAMLFVRF